MKRTGLRMLCALLSLFLTFGTTGALAREAANEPTLDELLDLCDAALEQALLMPPVSAEADEEGGYAFDYGTLHVSARESSLSADTRLTAAALTGENELWEKLRGITPGSSVEALLEAYPLDNATLSGSAEEATLYIRGILPADVSTGRVVRNGSHVLVAEYDLYSVDGERVEKSCLIFTLENNAVAAAEAQLGVAEMSLEEAQEEIEALSDLQEVEEYSVYRSDDPEPLEREDLLFGDVDFLTATVETMIASLSEPQSDTWEQDGQNFLRILQWEGVQAIFEYDGGKTAGRLILLEVYGEILEGPRGLHMDDSLSRVLMRFPHENDVGTLYGDGRTAPYGRCDMEDDGAHVAYAVEVEGQTVVLTLLVIDDRLMDMTCTYL